ncbi:hypothetical protein, partial [Vibrio nigripulchritudo]|uniref:hypothetical protein n=1 Tax=Vibrio nigripulchritudo TaxID=28173 RepID=UPI0019526920
AIVVCYSSLSNKQKYHLYTSFFLCLVIVIYYRLNHVLALFYCYSVVIGCVKEIFKRCTML